jgi:precorrin-2 dehydrogenase/sirohydrochlorin ferrochelatase
VIGDGPDAERHARALVRFGAVVTVVSAAPAAALLELEDAGALHIERRGYVRGDLADVAVAFCRSGSNEIDRAVAAEAAERGCLLHLADDPSASSFIPADTEDEA